jgi:charged multivesicular body protein 5
LNDELGELFQQSEDVQDVLGRDLNMPVIDDAELEEQLELLGQDFVADTDSSYLDEALRKPTVVGPFSLKNLKSHFC